MIEHTTGGKMSLAQLADGHESQPSTIVPLTAEHSSGGAYPANVAAYINRVFHDTIFPRCHAQLGCTSTCPKENGDHDPLSNGESGLLVTGVA